MPLFGAHMSVAGGLHNALLAAEAAPARNRELPTKNASQWQAPELSRGRHPPLPPSSATDAPADAAGSRFVPHQPRLAC